MRIKTNIICTMLTFLLLGYAADCAFAQTLEVRGAVTDAQTGEAVPFAAIRVKGTDTGASTDADGRFTIAVAPDAVLNFSSIGYLDTDVKVAGKKELNVTLQPDSEMLESTVVIGYGSAQKIGNIVGSVTTVNSEDLATRPSANIGDALQGKVAGLQVFSTSGEPSKSVAMQIRGTTSLNLSTAPLYILDGVPVSSSIFSSISPLDIENISILKDASSTAIYGSRAANGVIFITTKKGKKGEKATVSLRAQYGISMLTNYNLDMMNSEQLFEFEEMCVPALKTDPQYQARKAFTLGNGINFDWTDYLYDKYAPTVQADLSLRGASDKSDYYVSLGYYNEEGTAKINSGMQRFTFRANLNAKFTDWFKFGFNLGLTYSESSSVVTGWYIQSPIMQAVTGLPYYTPYNLVFNEDGTFTYGEVMEIYPFNNQQLDLLEYYKKNTNKSKNAGLVGQTYFQFTPVKGLTIRAAQAIDATDGFGEAIYLPSYQPMKQRGTVNNSFSRYYQLSSTNTIEYKTGFSTKNFFTILLGHESIYKNVQDFGAIGTGLTDDRLHEFGSTTDIVSWNGGTMASAFNSFFANLNYNYCGRYFLDASVRTDGASLFGKNHKYATFYSVGLMWKIKNESFMQNASFVDDLNLNVSYGTTGNSGLSSWYAHLGLVGTGSKYNGNGGLGLAQVPNEDLTWETVSIFNVSLTGRLFNRVSFDLQAYSKQSSDLLMELPFSGTTGHSYSWGNVASLNNSGFDGMVSVDIIHNRDFYWNITANVNYNRNKITKLYQGLNELAFPSMGLKYEVGKSSSLCYTYISAGVDPQTGEPMWYDRNGNKVKEYSEDLMQFWEGHDSVSPWSGGFSTNFSWKGIGLSADFSWIGDRWIFMNERYYTMNTANLFNTNFETKMLNMWTTPGQETDVPKYGTQYRIDTSIYSNAAFLRLKNLTLSYSFPTPLIQKSHVLEGVKLYFTGRNLWTYTKFAGYDPEVGAGNGTTGFYPNSRQFVIGAELVF
ncbi:MAG: SusC/RagA family TonB-linked outer membrane protein [Candidatus Cryptobacteroides sp.]